MGEPGSAPDAGRALTSAGSWVSRQVASSLRRWPPSRLKTWDITIFGGVPFNKQLAINEKGGAETAADNDSDAAQVSFCRPGLMCWFASDTDRVGSGKDRPLKILIPSQKEGQGSSETQAIYRARLYKLKVWTPRLEVSDFGAAMNKCEQTLNLLPRLNYLPLYNDTIHNASYRTVWDLWPPRL